MLRIRLHTLYVSVPSISVVAKPLRLMCRFSMLLSYTGWLLYHLPTRQFFEELNSVALFYLNYSQKVTFVAVYENIDQKIVVVQQRSPLVKVWRIWMNWSFWDASLELKMMCPIISGQKEAVYWQTNKLDRWKQIQSNYNTHWVICTWKKRFTAYWVSSYHSNNFRYIPLLKMFNIHAEIKKGTIC